MITELTIENFKSFGPDSAPIHLGTLNFVVGANASGKTNLISALRFLKIALTQGVVNAEAAFGGVEEVWNRTSDAGGTSNLLRLQLKLDGKRLGPVRFGVPNRETEAKSFDYLVEIDFRVAEDTPFVMREELKVVFISDSGQEQTYVMKRTEEKVEFQDPVFQTHLPSPILVQSENSTRLAAGTNFFSVPITLFRSLVDGWSFYNISPETARYSYKDVIDLNLGHSGENLAAIIHKLETGNGGSISLDGIISGLQGAVPGFNSIKSISLGNQGMWSYQIIEDHIRGAINPHSVSDGTIRLLTLAIMTQWSAQRASLLVVEEPENGLHPHLSKHIVEMFRTASKNTQVIATTHNPSFLDELEPNEVILCDKVDGLTQVKRASDIAEIETFRKHFSLGELWEQGALGGIP